MAKVVQKGNMDDRQLFERVDNGKLLKGFYKKDATSRFPMSGQRMIQYNDKMRIFNDITSSRDFTVECQSTET